MPTRPALCGFAVAAAIICTFVPPGGSPAARADAAASKESKDKFESGKRAYRLAEFDEAIRDWKEGYRLSADPVFLFNIAQAYREKKDFEQAIKFYENYLREAKRATNRGMVQARIKELKEELRKREEASKAPPTGPLDHPSGNGNAEVDTAVHNDPAAIPGRDDAAAPSPVTADTTSMRSGRGLKIAGLVTGGAGVALVATGVVFGLAAKSAQSDVETAVANHQPFDPAVDEAGKRDGTIALVGLGVGAAALATGGVLYYLGVHKDREAAGGISGRVSVLPGVGGTARGITLRVKY
jgi:tetratricopeptide (TPR) repeat protein